MVKKYLLFSLISIFVIAPTTFAQTNGIKVYSNNGNNLINIPAEVQKIVPQKDLVEVLCYETKWRASEATNKINAVKEALTPILKKVGDLGVKNSLSVLDNMNSYTDKVNKNADAVCGADSLDELKMLNCQI